MNEINFAEYPLKNNAYAAFDAISLRNLIISRMNEQKLLTDQNYIGSNLASIIDIVSFAYNTLLFYLNRTSTESTFTEAQLYENINRIVKLLDYNPTGYQTSTLSFQASATSKFSTEFGYNPATDLSVGQTYIIPRYSYISIGGIPFSFNEDIVFNTSANGITLLQDVSNKKLLYQGLYKENPSYSALGDASEMITIDNSSGLIDHFNMDVYVHEANTQTWVQYDRTTSLYPNRPFSRSYEKRLNSNGVYELTFGDGINGRKLEAGDKVVVYYLESSGSNGVIGPNTINNMPLVPYSTSTFEQILTTFNTTNSVYLTNLLFGNLKFENVIGSTVPKQAEDVNSIRKNAPSNFKSQYRLVTKNDYETFIRINFANFISDIKVFSNWDYTSSYLKYFNDLKINPTEFNQILLNQFLYSDSCNFNNIYICAIPSISPRSSLKYLLPAQKEAILSNINPLKTMTSEIVFMDPIYKAISLGVKTNSDSNIAIQDREFCNLVIEKSYNNKRSPKSIALDVFSAFKNFFNPLNTKIGQPIKYSDLVNRILAVDGVRKIKTQKTDTGEVFDGLCLWAWNPNYPEIDKQTIVNDTNMEEFSFVYYDKLEDLASKIQVIEVGALD